MKKAVFIITFLVSIMLIGCGKQDELTSVNTDKVTEDSEDSVIIETGNTVTSYLTGMQVDETIGRFRPISVMFNNAKEGCPQTGISRADVVYEAPLASNVTRLIGIIEDWHDLEKIGSIRSTRDYYVSFALEFDAIHVHFGQATAYVGDMLNSDLVDNISDGSGLSRMNYVSPDFFCRFLTSMMASPHFEDYIYTLPSPGSNGTLSANMKGSPAEMKARIKVKSGSMGGVRCYSGYIIPTEGCKDETIVFSIMVNNCTAPTWKLRQLLDKIMAAFAAAN